MVKLVVKFDTTTVGEMVKDFDTAQSRLEEICKEHHGKAALQCAWYEDEEIGMAYSLYSIDAQGN